MNIAESKCVFGLSELAFARPDFDEERAYILGKHPRPFAVQGVSQEYQQLMNMSVANWINLVIKAPVQRLRVDGFRVDSDSETDSTLWRDVWLANHMEKHERALYRDVLAHGRGFVFVWPNADNLLRPTVKVESPSQVYVERESDSPDTVSWAVKKWCKASYVNGKKTVTEMVSLFEPDSVKVFQARSSGNTSLVKVGEYVNDLGVVPFVEFNSEPDSLGDPQSFIRPLFPMQRAIDTMRFDLLLAAQFSAYRQRVVTGFDPRVRDSRGEIVYLKDSKGNNLVDGKGNLIPAISSMGRPGVDRLMVFPGADTKIFDLNESNLSRYVDVIKLLVQQLAAISQVPPQYLLGEMANLSGEALDAAESTLGSLVSDLKRSFTPQWAEVIALADRARGGQEFDSFTDIVWGDGEVRSFAKIVDGIQKLIATGFPRKEAWAMLPQATTKKVELWESEAREEANSPFISELAAGAANATFTASPDSGVAADADNSSVSGE